MDVKSWASKPFFRASCWFRVLIVVSSVQKGVTGEIFLKQGNSWKKHHTLMTHDTLSLFKAKPGGDKKPKAKFLFQHATDVDLVEEEQKSDCPTSYAFVISFGSVSKYFCATTSEQFKDWVDSVTSRIKGKSFPPISSLKVVFFFWTKEASYLYLHLRVWRVVFLPSLVSHLQVLAFPVFLIVGSVHSFENQGRSRYS